MEPVDFVGSVDDGLLCSICHNVMIKPRTCPEGHQFCLGCISSWLERSKTCPMRCGKLTKGRLTNFRFAEKQISELNVICRNSAAPHLHPSPEKRRRLVSTDEAQNAYQMHCCTWIGPLADREKHLEQECQFAKAPCRFQGCGANVLRLSRAEHEATCDYRIVSCSKCNVALKACNVGRHLLQCKQVEIACPHECGATLPRGKLQEHEEECGEMVQHCPFAEFGCEVHAKRRKMAEHEEEAVAQHAQLAAKRAQQLQHEITELKRELRDKAEEMTETTSEAAALIKELEFKFADGKRQMAMLSSKLLAEQQTRARLEDALQRGRGQTQVVWKIQHFARKAASLADVDSQPFCVNARGVEYRLVLRVGFARSAGSPGRGFLSLRVAVAEGSSTIPVALDGTVMTVTTGGSGPSLTLPLSQSSTNQADSGPDGHWQCLLSADQVPAIDWSRAASEVDSDWAGAAKQVAAYYDVWDFLRDDSITIRGTICATPPSPAEICI